MRRPHGVFGAGAVLRQSFRDDRCLVQMENGRTGQRQSTERRGLIAHGRERGRHQHGGERGKDVRHTWNAGFAVADVLSSSGQEFTRPPGSRISGVRRAFRDSGLALGEDCCVLRAERG